MEFHQAFVERLIFDIIDGDFFRVVDFFWPQEGFIHEGVCQLGSQDLSELELFEDDEVANGFHEPLSQAMLGCAHPNMITNITTICARKRDIHNLLAFDSSSFELESFNDDDLPKGVSANGLDDSPSQAMLGSASPNRIATRTAIRL